MGDVNGLEVCIRAISPELEHDQGTDLISMLAHNESTRHMDVQEYQGTVVLLIIGGNDTTRNHSFGNLVNPIQSRTPSDL